MNRLTADRGVALVSVLFCLAGLFVLTATLFLTTFLDLQSTSSAAAAADALYVADAGIHDLWSLLDPSPDFSAALAWPGGRPPVPSPGWFDSPPRAYRVEVSPEAGGGLLARSEGTADRSARATVEAIFRRESSFRPVAALVIGESLTSASASGSVALDGNDRDLTETALLRAGAETRDAANRALAALGSAVAFPVVGSSGLEVAAGILRSQAGWTLTGPHSNGTWGTTASPEVVRLIGDAAIDGDVTACGIVVADAPLRVRGQLEVEGLLLAARGLEVDGSLVVHGGLWVAEALTISSSGRLQVEYASTALARADGLRPGVLPRVSVLGAWREVW